MLWVLIGSTSARKHKAEKFIESEISSLIFCKKTQKQQNVICNQGPVVQSVVSLTSSLRVISLSVVADSIYNILIFFAEKM